ncbi:MAG TPA: preprotein translocase subunit SecG [Tepidisphaeraceae bacterium]|jgi:preprotein translocase subunit SecG
MNFLFWLFYVLLFIVSLFLVLLVLIQKGRGGGLSSAFGGGGGNTAFGSKTGDVLTWATSIVFGVFMILSAGLVLIADYRNAHPTGATTTVTMPTAPATPGSPAAP